MKESRFRSILKAISWRILGSIDTIILSFIVAGNPISAFKIGFSELLSKMFLYYAHERIWQKWIINVSNLSNKKIFIKSLSWRFFGTIDTILLSWFYTESLTIGLKIGFLELFTKVFLYYLHEKFWLFIPRGTMRKYFPYLEDKRQQLKTYVNNRNTSNIQ
jgi:uncharacterized membrane protein